MHHFIFGISCFHSVNLILFTLLLVYRILRISPHHSPHLRSHHLSLPHDLKLTSFPNFFPHIFSVPFGLPSKILGTGCVCFSFFCLYVFCLKIKLVYRLSWPHSTFLVHVKLFSYRCCLSGVEKVSDKSRVHEIARHHCSSIRRYQFLPVISAHRVYRELKTQRTTDARLSEVVTRRCVGEINVRCLWLETRKWRDQPGPCSTYAARVYTFAA